VFGKSVRCILFGLALAVLLAACSSSGAPAAQTTTTVNVTAQDTFKYDPATITAKVGQPIQVVLTNKGVLVHSFVIDELNVKVANVQGGATGDATFTPTQAGTYVFYCEQPGHRAAGMTGTLVVSQ